MNFMLKKRPTIDKRKALNYNIIKVNNFLRCP